MNEGVTYTNGKFNFDFGNNTPCDIINFTNLMCYKTNIRGDVYFYGYAFRKDISSSLRSNFIHALKMYEKEISEEDRKKFINEAIGKFLASTRLSHIDCIIYPRSERTDINHRIVKELSHGLYTYNYSTFELVKLLPKHVSFNKKRFEEDKQGIYNDKQLLQIYEYIEILLNKIHLLDYFSIAENVKTKYRPYIMNYLSFKTKDEEELFKSLKQPVTIIVDDINTSFSTLQEIIRIVKSINPESKLIAFTLIDKNF